MFFVGPNMKQGKVYEIFKLEKNPGKYFFKCAKKENPAKNKKRILTWPTFRATVKN